MDAIVAGLSEIRKRFDPAANRRRAKLLRRARAEKSLTTAQLVAYHEELLFLSAYPPNAALLAAVTRELRRITHADQLKHHSIELLNSGLAGTPIQHPFSLDLLNWLLSRREPVAPAWDHPETDAALSDLLTFVAQSSEIDGLYSDALTWKEWLRRAAGRRKMPLAWLVDSLRALARPPEMLDRLLEALDFQVVWRPRRAWSRTIARLPGATRFFQRDELVRHISLPALLAKPIRRPRPLSIAAARKVIDIARATLAVRLRETDPVTHANERDVRVVRLERGIDIALIGMRAARRLPVESFVGYVAARNGVPVAYGGGWLFFERCEIGINLFETFRGGESALLFGQILRTFHQLFAAETFSVDPYQFGAGNAEGLQSGAFWFYYRLGFRPADRKLASLAETEAARQRQTPVPLLRRLTGAPLMLNTRQPHADGYSIPSPVPDLKRLGLAVTNWIARRFNGERAAAEQFALSYVQRGLQLGPMRSWTDDERTWSRRLAPLAAMIPDLAQWPLRERAALGEVLRSKGGPRETEYIARLRSHQRLREAWIELQPRR